MARGPGLRTSGVVVRGVLVILMLVTLYPFVYVVSMSLSDAYEAMSGSVWLFPKGLSTRAYEMVFENPYVWRSYYNTVWYTVVGTILNVVMTILGAYPLSKKNLTGGKLFTLFIVFTMFFGGGLIPLYLVVMRLGMYNTRWAILIPSLVSAWYLVIARTFFRSIPESLEESARMDGANDVQVLFRVVVPLSMPIVAVLCLFYAVGHWNSFFPAMIYLSEKRFQPLQIYLRRVLIENAADLLGDIEGTIERSAYSIQLKYAVIVVAVLPILLVYPFVQRYFVKGVMIGAIKG